MLPDYDVPEQALRAFERATGLRVCFHDAGHMLGPYLPPERFAHHNPFCTAVKAVATPACLAFDGRRTHRDLDALPEGRVQVCHAGLVEWVVPLRRVAGPAAILFAGQRLPGPALKQVARDGTPAPIPLPWTDRSGLLRPVDDDEASWLLELSRQLAARLQTWVRETPAPQAIPRASSVFDVSDLATRRGVIHHFVHSRHRQSPTLSELAKHLHLSESRAGHVVKEACGATFVALLSAARLRTAAALLRHSNLSVLDVAMQSGFNDVSHFHYEFKKHFGTTPHRYRRQAEVKPPA